MKRFFLLLSFALLALVCVSCGKEDSSVNLDEIEFKDGFYQYDSFNETAYSIECKNIPDGYSVSYFGNGVYNAGVHSVTARVFDGEGNEVTRIKRNIYVIDFTDEYVGYDGEEHSIPEISGLPSQYVVEYDGNSAVELGTHEVTAYIKDTKDNNKVVCELTALLVIEIDTSIVEFEDVTVEYDGEEHSIEIPEYAIPYGVTVEYEGNGVSTVGEHTVTAKLYDSNNELVLELTATLTITPAGGEDHVHEAGSSLKYDENGHWSVCECGEKVNETSHTYSEDITKQPSLTEEGEKTFTCVCGHSYTETLPMLELTGYYLKINESTYVELTWFEDADGFTQYSCSADVVSGDTISVLLDGVVVTNIGDERINNQPNNNNIYGSNDNMVILVTATSTFYFKVYADGHAIYATGNLENYPSGGSQGGGSSSENVMYRLVINGTTQIDLIYEGKWDMDNSFDQHHAFSVTLNAGDIITFLNVSNNETWTDMKVDGASHGGMTLISGTGIKVGTSGVYDIYVKTKWQSDNIYFGPAQ